jgi:plastocyanin
VKEAVFLKRKLNRCAHCDERTTAVTFSSDGRLYFLCRPHRMLLMLLVDVAARHGVKL